jgi:hypothetical protein
MVKRLYFRGDAAFANPEIYEFLEAEGIGYTIRLPANAVLQNRIGHLLKRPVGRPPHEVRRYYANFTYQAQSWNKPRRVVVKVEWHPGELHPRVGFIVTNLARPAERAIAFYNQRALRSPFALGDGNLLLPNTIKEVIVTSRPRSIWRMSDKLMAGGIAGEYEFKTAELGDG